MDNLIPKCDLPNHFDFTQIYYTITTANESYHRFSYKSGINIDDKMRISYFTFEDIPNFYNRGIYLREVFLPNIELYPHVELEYNDKYNLFFTSMAYFGDRHNLLDLATYTKLGLNAKDNAYICKHAAANGRLDLIKWARINGNYYIADITKEALSKGHIDILQWAHQNHALNNKKEICELAAYYGHLEIVQWARQNNFYWDEWVFTYAAERGHIEIMNWAYQNGCPINLSDVKSKVIETKNYNVIKWLMKKGFYSNRVNTSSQSDPLRASEA